MTNIGQQDNNTDDTEDETSDTHLARNMQHTHRARLQNTTHMLRYYYRTSCFMSNLF